MQMQHLSQLNGVLKEKEEEEDRKFQMEMIIKIITVIV